LDITDVNVINAFTHGTTCESLVHNLGCSNPCTIGEVLNIAPTHARGEEAILTNFDKGSCMAKHDEESRIIEHYRPVEKRGGRKARIAIAVSSLGQSTPLANSVPNTRVNFKKVVERSYPNHARPIKHAYTDCDIFRCFICNDLKPLTGKKKHDSQATEECGV